ncbi:hypothetical protein ACEPPN_017319 [Leptodophora sp. 'Broadleaf-Isolate-01']
MAKLSMKTVQQFNGIKLKVEYPWEQKNKCEYHEHPGNTSVCLCTGKVSPIKEEVEAKKEPAQNPPPAPTGVPSSAHGVKRGPLPTKKVHNLRIRQLS